jgi:hypothetical protein
MAQGIEQDDVLRVEVDYRVDVGTDQIGALVEPSFARGIRVAAANLAIQANDRERTGVEPVEIGARACDDKLIRAGEPRRQVPSRRQNEPLSDGRSADVGQLCDEIGVS